MAVFKAELQEPFAPLLSPKSPPPPRQSLGTCLSASGIGRRAVGGELQTPACELWLVGACRVFEGSGVSSGVPSEILIIMTSPGRYYHSLLLLIAVTMCMLVLSDSRDMMMMIIIATVSITMSHIMEVKATVLPVIVKVSLLEIIVLALVACSSCGIENPKV